jgi:hypothetical protein
MSKRSMLELLEENGRGRSRARSPHCRGSYIAVQEVYFLGRSSLPAREKTGPGPGETESVDLYPIR